MTTQTRPMHEVDSIPGTMQIRSFGAQATASDANKVKCKRTVIILGMEFTRTKWFDGDTCPSPWRKA